jgi:Do/DeqQ family serine protease
MRRFAFLAVLAAGLCLAPPSTAAARHLTRAEAQRLSDAFVAVAEKVSPSVVQIEVAVREQTPSLTRWYRTAPWNNDTAVQRGMGSGVVVSADGSILTNNHVVEDALSISVRLRDGRILPAKLVGSDPATDLALVRVEAKHLTPVRFADSDAVRVGEWVVAIGSPFGLGYTVTTGVVSAKGRGGVGINSVEDYLQTDASINPGNSGGPLVNLDGRVLGINTMIVGKGQGIGFAVPSNIARRTADQIAKDGHVRRAWIGVGIQDVSPEIAAELKTEAGAGALVNGVAPTGPGAKARLRAGDIITGVGGKRVHDAQELIRELLSKDAGQSVYLEVIRGGKHYGTTVELFARPDSPAARVPVPPSEAKPKGLGLTLRDLPGELAAQLGLGSHPLAQIVQVAPGSAADRAGLRPGDVVIEADGLSEPTSAQLSQMAKDEHMLLRVRRRDAVFYAAVRW